MVHSTRKSISCREITVVILAAGHGKRMLPLTSNTPKPLLKVGSKSLIEHHLYRLSDMGFQHVVVNTAYLAGKIQSALGDGSRYGLCIEYSDESNTGALETAGGIVQALPLIRSDQFLVVNADIWTDYPFDSLVTSTKKIGLEGRLVLVNNPAHNADGDFLLTTSGMLENKQENGSETGLTYSGIALYHKTLFRGIDPGPRALAPLLKQKIIQQRLSGELYTGIWNDIGTPQRLEHIRESFIISSERQLNQR